VNNVKCGVLDVDDGEGVSSAVKEQVVGQSLKVEIRALHNASHSQGPRPGRHFVGSLFIKWFMYARIRS
jgi:hypothetical protein